MFTYTNLYCIWLHGSQQQEFFWLQQPEPGMEKLFFPPLLSFLKKPQAEHVAHSGSCLVFTLWMCFALWDRTHLMFRMFLRQISPFPAHRRTFSLHGRVHWSFLARYHWFLTAAQTVRWCMRLKGSLKESFPGERFCWWHRLRNISISAFRDAWLHG